MENQEVKIQIHSLSVTVVDTAVQIWKTSVNTDCKNCPVRCLSFSMAAGMQKYMHPHKPMYDCRKLKARCENLFLIHSALPQPAAYRLI